MKKHGHSGFLSGSAEYLILHGFVLEDLLTDCEHTADHCPNVAVEMLQAAEGKLEAHEYLNALKVGDL